MGANTAIFSVVEAVVLAPLPYADPDRLVKVKENSLTLQRNMSVSYPDWGDWRREAQSFERTAALRWQDRNLTSPGFPEHLNGRQISSGFFRTLGVKLFLGREFSVQEDLPGGAPVVLISHRLWRNRFGRSAAALGKSIVLDGADYTIVGVVPAGFNLFGNDADVYTPLGQGDPLLVQDRSVHPGIICFARLKLGVTVAQARAEMAAVQDRLSGLYPTINRGVGTDVIPLKRAIVGDTGRTLLLLLGAVGLVLLIACANVANLLLARSVARTREFAIRVALGASRARIAGQLIAEGVLLSLVGGGLGVAIAMWTVGPALTTLAGRLPRGESAGVNFPVLLFTGAVSVAVGILFGLSPAANRPNTSRSPRLQQTLVIVQMALTLVLLTGAGLLFRTIRNLWDVDPGFNAHHVIAFKAGLSPSTLRTPSGTRGAYQQLIERIRQIPGVQAADLTALIPLSPRANNGPFWAGVQAPASISEAPRALFYWTGPEYLKTLRSVRP